MSHSHTLSRPISQLSTLSLHSIALFSLLTTCPLSPPYSFTPNTSYLFVHITSPPPPLSLSTLLIFTPLLISINLEGKEEKRKREEKTKKKQKQKSTARSKNRCRSLQTKNSREFLGSGPSFFLFNSKKDGLFLPCWLWGKSPDDLQPPLPFIGGEGLFEESAVTRPP